MAYDYNPRTRDLIMGALEGARVLTHDNLQRWQTFAEDAWTAWKAEDAAVSALDKPTSARA